MGGRAARHSRDAAGWPGPEPAGPQAVTPGSLASSCQRHRSSEATSLKKESARRRRRTASIPIREWQASVGRGQSRPMYWSGTRARGQAAADVQGGGNLCAAAHGIAIRPGAKCSPGPRTQSILIGAGLHGEGNVVGDEGPHAIIAPLCGERTVRSMRARPGRATSAGRATSTQF